MNPRRFRGSSAWALTLLVAFAGAPRVAGAQTPPAPAAESPRTALLPEPGFITRGIDFATRTIGDGSGDKSGFYPDLADMISGAGWISAGPGYRQWINGDRIFFDASAAISWRAYKTARTRLEFTNLARSRVAIGGEIKWQDYTQVSYFGEGPESLEANRSEYRVRSTDSVGYANLKPVKWLTLGARAGWLYRPELMERAGPFTRGFPDMREVFPDDPAFALSEQPSYLHGELFVTADTRDQRSHPVRGGVYRTGWSRYWDRDAGTFSFQRVEAEAAQFIPVADSRLTIALHGWVAASDTAEGAEVPFYLLPSLGGSNTLRSYSNYRFHDRHLALVNAEARVALFEHIDIALFGESGNVATRLADLNLNHTSFGVGVRVHSVRSTFARLDVAHGSEGWRVIANLSDPLHLSRLTRRAAAPPFVP